MMQPTPGSHTQIHLFTSHAFRYSQRRDGLLNLLSPTWVRNHDFMEWSVSKEHPLQVDDDPELADQLVDRIFISDVLLVAAGMFAHNRDWMIFEIHAAKAHRKPIIPVIMLGQERVPRVATRFAACEPVHWRGESIRAKILELVPSDRRAAFEMRRRSEIDAVYKLLPTRGALGAALRSPLVGSTDNNTSASRARDAYMDIWDSSFWKKPGG